MSLPKAQLVDPQGNMNLPGMTATGIVTATSLKGVTTGSVTNLTGSPDLDVGIVTGSSFVGDGTGHAANITGTPELNLGVTTATSFVGDAVGKAAGLTGTPNLNVGLITATSFVGFVTGDVTGNISGNVVGNITGDISGLAGGLGINGTNVWTGAGTSNLGVGVCTATLLYGDGSGLVGAGSSAYIAQNITASGDETIIDLSYGNLIYYKGQSDTTVGFASTSAAEQLTFIRDASSTFAVAYNESISTAAVDFNGSNQKLELAATADFHFGTDDFTIECFANRDADTNPYPRVCNFGPYYGNNDSIGLGFDDSDYPGKVTFFSVRNANQGTVPSNGRILVSGSSVTTGTWYHLAVTRTSGTFRLFIDGVLESTNSSIPSRDLEDSATNTLAIAGTVDRMVEEPFDGKISNFRIINGTSLYTKTFLPPSAALTNVTNTKLLCCQTAGNAGAAAVTPGSISDINSPTAASYTVAYSGTNDLPNGTITWPDRVKWNNGTTPTLTNTTFEAAQIFRFTTVDTGLNYNAWQDIETQTSYNLFGWGNNVYGSIGQNDRTQYSSPIQIDGQWSALSNGHMDRDFSMAFKGDGTLWAWGTNFNGQIAQNDRTPGYSSPTQIPGTTWNEGAAAAFKEGGIASKADGTTWVWGWNAYGALGLNQGHPTRISSPTQLPGTWGTSRGKMGAGFYSTFAIKANGTLWSWGYNSDGQLGQNTTGFPTSKSSPTQIGTNTNWNIFCENGYNWVGAIKTDGTLWMWGDGDDGQLGLNTGPSPRRRSSPTQVPGTNWSNLVLASTSTLASKTDGTLWSFGKNGEGELGLNTGGSPTSRSSPCQIPGTTWTSNIAGGSSGQFAAVKTDGTLWTWGQATNGQLGHNDAIPRSSPTQIPGTKWEKMGSGTVFFSLQQP